MSTVPTDQPRAPRAATSFLWHPSGVVVARVVVGGLFIYASAAKIGHAAEFARIIYSYRVLHPDLVNLGAIWLPWIEMLAGVLLVVGMGRRGAGLVTSGLMVLFIVVGGLGILRGLDIECGCFTVSGSGMRLGWSGSLRDLGLLAASVYATLHPSSAWSIDGLVQRSLTV